MDSAIILKISLSFPNDIPSVLLSPLRSSREHCNEISGLIRGGELLD